MDSVNYGKGIHLLSLVFVNNQNFESVPSFNINETPEQ